MSAVVKIFKAIVGVFAIIIGVVTGNFLLIAFGVSTFASILKGNSNGTKTELSKVNVRMGEPDRWLCAGRVRQGGAALFGEFDSAGNFWYVMVHSDSILVNRTKIYLDEIEVTLDGSGNVLNKEFRITPKGEPVTTDGTGNPHFQIWTTTYSETDPTPPAISALASTFPTKWTSDHKLVGTTYSVIRVGAPSPDDHYKIFKWRGAFGLGEPSIGIVGDWSHVYDPRDSGQTNGTPATYLTSRNPVLIWAWFRTHRYGRNKARSSINWTKVAEQAAICDQTVTGLVGTHTRYTCDIAIPESRPRSEAEAEIMLTADMQLVFDDDGKCWPRVGYYATPTVTLSRNRDIVAMESVEAQNGESETQGVIVRYTDPAAKYTPQPSAGWVNPLYYQAGQPVTFATIDALAITDHNQAMRIAKAIGMRMAPAHKLAPTVGLRGLRARQERIINLQYDNEFAGDYEICTQVQVDPVGVFCGMGIVPVDANRWSLLAGEEHPKPVVDDAGTYTTPVNATGVTATYTNGRIEAVFASPGSDSIGYEFQYILTANISGGLWFDMTVQIYDLFAFSPAVAAGLNYSVQYRAVTASGAVSAWSSPLALSVATPIDPSTMLSATDQVGSALVQWRNPTTDTFAYTKIYTGTTSTFGSATQIGGSIAGGLGQVQTYSHTTTAGTHYYWVRAYASDNTAAALTGPVSVVVT